MPIFLMPEVCKIYMYIVTFVTPGVEYRSTQVPALWNFCQLVSNIFTVYGNTITHIITFVKTFLKSIHGIHNSHVTYNMYFLIFVILTRCRYIRHSRYQLYLWTDVIQQSSLLFLINLFTSLFTSKI